MATVTLRDLYAAELHDLMNAETQIVEALPVMAGHATSSRLRRALDDHHVETKIHVERLGLLIEQLNEPPHRVPDGAAAALIKDARRRISEVERGDTLDAALIAAAQRLEHYEMASYGTARSYAESLGDDNAARILQQTLDEERRADHAFTKLAENGINQAAGENLVEDSTRYRSHLRYVATKDLPGAREEGDLNLHNLEGEHVGTLDGFITDSQSGRPIYYVIDSGGWFAGRRYVLPVSQIEAEVAGTTLRTALTRETLSRYPEFSPSAFTAMGDEDALKYERRLHRAFDPDAKPYDGRPAYENLPAYRTPTWLMTGDWTSDANVAPVSGVPEPSPETGTYERTTAPFDEPGVASPEPRVPYPEPGVPTPVSPLVSPESELMMARDEPEGKGEPRIERYRDR